MWCRALLHASFLLLGCCWLVQAATTVRVPVAIIVIEPSTSALPPPFFVPLPELNYTASFFIERTFFNGFILAAERHRALGGFVIGNNSYILDVAVFNRAHFPNSTDEFAAAVVSHAHQPILIYSMLSLSPLFEDPILISVARECQRTATCMLGATTANNPVHTCMPADTLAPECVGRLGRRRFRSTFCVLPNSDYIPESFISYMYTKQQTKVAFFGAGGPFTASASSKLPEILTHYPGMELVYTTIELRANCTTARVNDIVQHFQDTQPDIIIGVGVASVPPTCWASVLREMERRNYFPHAFNMMGGLGQGLIALLGPDDASRLCRYMYTSVALDMDASGYSYYAYQSPTHTELFEATDNMTSGAVYRDLYLARFGAVEMASPYIVYSMLGALNVVTTGLLLEVANGVLDARLWQTLVGQINSPSFAGTIQFDEMGQSLGLRLQLMNQFDLPTGGTTLTSHLVSGGSSYRDVFPAQLWSERLYRSYLMTGDELVPHWDSQYVILATAVLFFGCWSGMFRMQAVLKDVLQAYQKGVSWRRALMVLLAVISFADGGMWAFFVIAFQGLYFEPRDTVTIHAITRPLLPVTTLFALIALALVLVPVMYAYAYIYKHARRQVQRSIQMEIKQHHQTTATTSETSSSNTRPARDNLTHDMFDTEEQTSNGNIVIAYEKGLLARCWRRTQHVSLNVMARLALIGILWSICSIAMQLLLLSSLSQTAVVPYLEVGGCVGAIILACALSSLAFVLSGFFITSDVFVAGLHVATSLLTHIITTMTTGFVYNATATSTEQTLSSDIILLLGLLVGLVSTIVSILILLRKTGADNAHIQQENRQLCRDRELIRHALLESMRRARSNQQRQEAVRHFIRSQRVYMHHPAPDDIVRTRYSRALKQLVQVCDPHVADATAGLSMDDANLFLHSLSSEKQRKRELAHAHAHADELRTIMVATDVMRVTDVLLQDDLFAEWMDMSLRKTHCMENQLFLTVVDEYEQIATDEARHEEAAFVLQTFIIADAPLQVNLSADLVNEIGASVRRSTLNSTTKQLFSAARDEVARLVISNNIEMLHKDATFRECFPTLTRLAQAKAER